MNKKRDLRIVFMGTPDFAVASLNALLEHKYIIVGVITAPDKPAGRGQKLKISAVKAFAIQHQLKVLQPTNLKDENFIQELKDLGANLQIVVAFRMLPKVVWAMPEFGTFNLHASLLPQYRGAAPIHWAIINGEKETGVTTFFIDEKIDTGAIISSDRINITDDMTVGQLHDELMVLGSKLVVTTVQQIESATIQTKMQPISADLKTAYKLNRNNCKIDWTQSVTTIYNKIRGLNPFPAAWCYLKNGDNNTQMIKLFNVHKNETQHSFEPGKIVQTKSTLKVACKDGFIEVEEIQLPGKRKMTIKALLNGFKFSENAKLL